MANSALERAATDAFRALQDWVREHDRFVVIGLLFSLVPLPPACFVGLVISLVNAWLLYAGKLPTKETRPVCWALLLGTANSTAVVLGMLWISTQMQGADRLIDLPLVPDVVNSLLSSLLNLFGTTPPPPPPELMPI